VERPAFLFGRHAKNRLRWFRGTWREISAEEVIEIVTNPTQTTPTYEGRLNAWKQVRGMWFRVTFRVDGDTTVIVTVTQTRHGPDQEDEQ
jgi:hypothetical protein